MARRIKIITLQDREQTLRFEIKEMPATKLQDWMLRALLLIAGAGVEVPDGSDLKKAGAYLAVNGLQALESVDYDKARPLLDEMVKCCTRLIENVREQCSLDTVDNYIEDVTTLFQLEKEAFSHNLGFLLTGGESLFAFPESGSTEPLPESATTHITSTSPG
jgi:hypothetical protein